MMRFAIPAALLLVAAAGCSQVHQPDQNHRADEQANHRQVDEAQAPTVYVATLRPLNADVTGTKTHGQARFVIDGDQLTITIDVKDAPPDMVHWQHIHGFKDDRPANCPTASADVNGDGIIDLRETEPASGTTMVPFNADPARMDVAADTYPKADANGDYHYQTTVSLKALQSAFAKAFDGQPLDLANRVVYIHGVPSDTKLPKSVASLGTIPAQVTLPIACGKILPVNR